MKIIQIAIGGEHNNKVFALTDNGRIWCQHSMYRNTKNDWSEIDLPEPIEK